MQSWWSYFSLSVALGLVTSCAAREPTAAPAAEVTLTAAQPMPEVAPVSRSREPQMPPRDLYRDTPPRYDLDDLPLRDFEPEPVFKPSPAVVGSIVPPPSAPTSLRRQAGLKGSKTLSCPFPPEADKAQIDQATVALVVHVDETGKPTKVTLRRDPGNGFGRAAGECMMKRDYLPALDDAGVAIAADTPPIAVRFTR